MDQTKTSKEVTFPAPVQASALAPALAPVAKSRWRDVLVYATIALVAVAVGIGLNLHMDVEVWLSAAVTVPLALALMQAHQLQLRGQQIAGLRRDIADLRRIAAQAARGQRDTTPGQAGFVERRKQSRANPVPGNAQPQNVQAPVAQGAQSAPIRPDSPLARQHATQQPPGGFQADTPLSTAVAAPLVAGKPLLPPPLPPSSLAASPLAHAARSSSLPVSAASAPAPSSTVSGMASVDTTQIASQVSGALMGTYWGHRPGVAHDASAGGTQSPGPGGGPGSALASANSPGTQGTSARAVSLVPGAGPDIGPDIGRDLGRDLDDGPGERELETMQNLIQQLAQQLNAPRGDSNQALPPASRASALDLDQSVAALRSTAATMRHDAEPEAGKAGHEPLVSEEPRIVAALRADASDMMEKGAEDQEAKADLAADEPRTVPGVAVTDAASHAQMAPVTPASEAVSAPASGAATASPYAQIARVAEAVAADRVEVFLDPILALTDRKARLFEVSVRLRSSDGDILDPASIRSVASGTGLLARIDAAKLSRSARVAARLQARGTTASLYSNLASESLSDDVFLDTFEDAIAEQDDLPKRLVLSFTQSDVRAFTTVHWETVTAMSEIGLRFALEDVTDLDMDFERLKDTGFEFIKLEASNFLEGLPAAGGAIPASDLCRHLADHGFTLIVGRIEDETSHAKLMGFGVLFGQGTFFGGARRVQVDRPAMQQQVAAA